MIHKKIKKFMIFYDFFMIFLWFLDPPNPESKS